MKRKILKTFVLSVMLLFVLNLHAKTNQELLTEGNTYYKNKDYSKAVESYEKVLSTNYEASELYYNLGNAYFRMNNYAPAILNYERALRMEPSNSEIKMNLNISNTRITDKMETIPELIITKILKSIITIFSHTVWATLCIIFVSILCVIACFYFLLESYNTKRWTFYSGIVVLAFLIISFLLANNQLSDYTNQKNAIIMESLVVVKSSPDVSSVDKFVIHAGTKVHIEDDLPEWFKIKLQNGEIGWVEKSTVEVI